VGVSYACDIAVQLCSRADAGFLEVPDRTTRLMRNSEILTELPGMMKGGRREFHGRWGEEEQRNQRDSRAVSDGGASSIGEEIHTIYIWVLRGRIRNYKSFNRSS